MCKLQARIVANCLQNCIQKLDRSWEGKQISEKFEICEAIVVLAESDVEYPDDGC